MDCNTVGFFSFNLDWTIKLFGCYFFGPRCSIIFKILKKFKNISKHLKSNYSLKKMEKPRTVK